MHPRGIRGARAPASLKHTSIVACDKEVGGYPGRARPGLIEAEAQW